MPALKALIKSVFTLFLCSALTATVGCSGKAATDDTTQEPVQLADSGNITLYRFDGGTVGAASYDDDWYGDFLNYYQKEYGGTVSAVSVEWQNWEEQFNTDLASGTAPDLIYLFEKNYLNLLNRGLLVSVEDMVEKGVVGTNHPSLILKQGLAGDLYSANGNTYAFACAYAEADMIFVNEDLFKQQGLTSPYQYYTAGHWDFDTFMQCAQSITRDTDGDGKNNVFGYYGFDPYAFVASAGGDLIKRNQEGALVSGVKDESTQLGLANYRNLYSKGYATDSYSQWLNGNVAMAGWLPQNEYKNLASDRLNFNWSVVPFPLDKSNLSGTRSGKCYGWAVTTPSVNWQGCVNYVVALNTYGVLNTDTSQPNYNLAYTAGQLEMFSNYAENIQLPLYNSVGSLKNTQWNLWGALADGKTTLKKAIDAMDKEVKHQIDAEGSAQ